MRKTGIGLLLVAYALTLYMSLAAPAYARAHPQLGAAAMAYTAAWPVALACALALNGIVLAVIPVARCEKWAAWLTAITFLILLVTRLLRDPRCLVVLDPHQHGCHTFLISVVLGLIGCALAGSRS